MYELKLPTSLTISNCDEFLNNVIEAKENNEKIQLDSSEVETLDTAGMQLIYSLCMDKGQVTHNNMSEKVREVTVILGLASA